MTPTAPASRVPLPVPESVGALELLSGVEAIVRVAVEQRLADQRAGLRTATLISGYPGSPLGTLDLALQRDHERLTAYGISHEPGVNEELAAATVWGTQQTRLLRDDLDGVLGMWYGKGPGVDRCGDVFKHANSMGASMHGGVLVVAGDDPSAKSSTLPNDSRFALMDASFPILAPSTVGDVIELGLHGFALSRFSGLWTALRVQTDLADGFAALVVADRLPTPVLPEVLVAGKAWQHVQRPKVDNTVSVLQEEEILNGRMEAARAYCTANEINRVTHGAGGDAWLGIAAVGKAHADLLEALAQLGLEGAALDRSGIRILKVAMPFPLEPGAIRAFASGLEEIVVVEEKRPLLETFVRDALYGQTDTPRVLGKRDEHGDYLVPGDGSLSPERLTEMLLARAGRRVPGLRRPEPAPAAPPAVLPANLLALTVVAPKRPVRVPAYCSGCPHNKSTAGPHGAVIGGGVGCHSIVYLEERHADDIVLPLTPMGAEGVPWIGMARYAKAPHVFQNLGDGTLAHSGSLAIRACVAAGVDITFKVLYNNAIAMTGGQHVAGTTPVPALTRELEAMGAARVLVLTDDPGKYGRVDRFADGTEVWHRDRLGEAEALLAATPGVTALVYDERCKAEARRLWKRGGLPKPTTRVMINESVCEGCGDCQVKSNCLSVIPFETPLGRKTQIHQPSCNFDTTCVKGDCPSFVTIEVGDSGSAPPRPKPPEPPADLPAPTMVVPTDHISSYMVGIGGTGVVTANRVLAAAAVRDGFTVAGLDQTGLSQKAGAVSSHLRAVRGDRPAANAVVEGTCTAYLAFDQLAGSDARHLSRIEEGVTQAVASSALAPTISIITQAYEPMPDSALLRGAIEAKAGRTVSTNAERLSETLFGTDLPSNVLMIGVAYQAGNLPLSAESIEEALLSTGGGGATNVAAFRWGRAVVARPDAVEAVLGAEAATHPDLRAPSARAERIGEQLLADAVLPAEVQAVADWRVKDLVDYQGLKVAARYLADVARVTGAGGASPELGEAFARAQYKLLAYKDEYEVARLHLDDRFRNAVAGEFPHGSVRYQLHPPLLRALGMGRKLAIPAGVAVPMFRVLRGMRRVRGTWVDPFGRAEVRRTERALPDELLSDVEEALGRSHDDALAVVAAVDEIRGYEGIKLAGVERFRAAVEALRAPVPDHPPIAIGAP